MGGHGGQGMTQTMEVFVSKYDEVARGSVPPDPETKNRNRIASREETSRLREESRRGIERLREITRRTEEIVNKSIRNRA